jgi:hypothetical protein
MFMCPNPACRQTFNAPLKALNLQEPMGVYDACPFCLTKVTSDNESVAIGKVADSTAELETTIPQTPAQPAETSVDCAFHFGYLGERTNKDQIPDSCLVCKSIVDCMIKK